VNKEARKALVISSCVASALAFILVILDFPIYGFATALIRAVPWVAFVWAVNFAAMYFLFRKYFSGGEYGALLRQTSINLSVDYETAYRLCIQSMEPIRNRAKKFSIVCDDRESGKISAVARLNWKTEGDRVEFELEPSTGQVTKVKVTSKPIAPMTLNDDGSNEWNIMKIREFLEQYELE